MSAVLQKRLAFLDGTAPLTEREVREWIDEMDPGFVTETHGTIDPDLEVGVFEWAPTRDGRVVAIETRQCVGCFSEVRPGRPEDHARGCPTGQNGTPNYE